MLKFRFYVIFFALFCNYSWAGPSDPIVGMAWVGETVPGQTTATLQMNLTTVKAIKLLSISSPLATSIEIQSLMMHKGAMKIQGLPMLPISDHRTTTFGSHGLFLMMTGIKQPLKSGDIVPVSLIVEIVGGNTLTIEANAEVKKMELSYKHYGPNRVYDLR